ncbi:hypothetical protein EV127DRAFT_416860 [Xylaria flabelliformis]|nr:hypothetical protein EV127DRAFT_416860 [Xylaria flabelliformis]
MVLVNNFQMAALLFSVALFLRNASASDVTTLEADVLAADGNITTLRTQLAPPWSTTSPVRSTANILWTSVVTLSVCVYTVVHVNVPPPGEKMWKLYRRKALWVLAAILAPEYALWTAYEQWDVVRRLHEAMQKYEASQVDNTGQKDDGEKKSEEQKSEKEQKHGRRQFDWTYCFYVAMGGLTVDVTPIYSEVSHMTITPTGLVLLAEHNHFIEIPKRTINDKSKADGLAKVLVCLQVAWLIIQSIGRAAKGLPIALLEIHVLAHVACALLLFGIWFKKPLDVYDAITVNSSAFEDEVALMLVISIANEQQQKEWRGGYNTDHSITAQKWVNLLKKDETCIEKRDERRERATRAAEKVLKALAENGTGADPEIWIKDDNPDFLVTRAKDVQVFNFARNRDFINLKILHRSRSQHFLIFGTIIFLTAAYAAIHLAAWRYHFPTEAEMWLWRASSLIIAGVVPTSCLLFVVWMGIWAILDSLETTASDTLTDIFSIIILISAFLLGLAYFSARAFLFIEAFISVRQMPIGVFVTMQWSDYIPHL